LTSATYSARVGAAAATSEALAGGHGVERCEAAAGAALAKGFFPAPAVPAAD
jgi:hypothetical protein